MKRSLAILATSASMVAVGCGAEKAKDQSFEKAPRPDTPSLSHESESPYPKAANKNTLGKRTKIVMRDIAEERVALRISSIFSRKGLGFAHRALERVDSFDSKGMWTQEDARDMVEGKITTAVIFKADHDELNYDPARFARATDIFNSFDDKGTYTPVKARNKAEKEAAIDLANTVIARPSLRLETARFARATRIANDLVDDEGGGYTPVKARDTIERIMIGGVIWRHRRGDSWGQLYEAASLVDSKGYYQEENADKAIEEYRSAIAEARSEKRAAIEEALRSSY